jgi:hypothetical protein
MPLGLVGEDAHCELQCDLPGIDPGSFDTNVEDRIPTIWPSDPRTARRMRRTG